MDAKQLMKTAGDRIKQLDKEVVTLRKESADKDAALQGALKKVAYYEREKKVDNILGILIDEKRYFPEAQRQEKKAYLMNEGTNLDDFLKMAGDLNPMDHGMFYEEARTSTKANRDEQFYDSLLNGMSRGIYGV